MRSDAGVRASVHSDSRHRTEPDDEREHRPRQRRKGDADLPSSEEDVSGVSRRWRVEFGSADPARYLRALDRVLRNATLMSGRPDDAMERAP